MVRRVLLLASMVSLLWPAPASAQTYGAQLNQSQTQVVISSPGPPTEAASADLARTGSSTTVPLVQASFVLLGGGFLLVRVGRRRQKARPV